ncbi:MAG TPA: cation transporter [Ignavibacteriaceae bacterium]|nr:cation transporter [Ignavibacteriaceae bacterium]
MKPVIESIEISDMTIIDKVQAKLFQTGIALSAATILFNIVEGIVSIYYGYSDKALTLFGFGFDSIIEAVSAIGIFVMIKRIVKNPNSKRNNAEILALKITGTGFYFLSAGLIISSILNAYLGKTPETTVSGIIISVVSMSVMYILMKLKISTGTKLNCQPILSDANCTKVCIYMSLVLLTASLIFKVTGFRYIDSIGALGIVYFSFKEGKEAFEKAEGIEHCDCDK